MRLLVRKDAPAPFPASASAAIATRLAGVLSPRPAGPVSLFAPLRDEPDLLGLIAKLAGIEWLFPRIDGPQIALHQVDDPASLIPGRFGILEPPVDAPGIPAGDVAVFICPGVAFDPGGRRLGLGGGFYDRLLSLRSPGSVAVGVCRDAQVVARLPAEPHDAHMDLVVTESRRITPPPEA